MKKIIVFFVVVILFIASVYVAYTFLKAPVIAKHCNDVYSNTMKFCYEKRKKFADDARKLKSINKFCKRLDNKDATIAQCVVIWNEFFDVMNMDSESVFFILDRPISLYQMYMNKGIWQKDI